VAFFGFNFIFADFIVSMQHVRRAAVLALSTFAHNKPNLIKGLLPDLLPLLYDQTIVKVISLVALCFVEFC
jgi:hypothetical protein